MTRGNYRILERRSHRQPTRRGGPINPARPAGQRDLTAAIAPRLGDTIGSIGTFGRI